MRRPEVIAWALDIIDRVQAAQPNEDANVEMKASWLHDYPKVARLIAGHANAARGEPILWLIGVDQASGVVVALHEELATWYAGICKQFVSSAPRVQDVNISVGNKMVVALLFETDLAPYVVKNPRFGLPDGGPVECEVPWREGTSTRSARREDLIRLLVPVQRVPLVEILNGDLRVQASKESEAVWKLQLTMYFVPQTDERLVIPFHRCQGDLVLPVCEARRPFTAIQLFPRRGAEDITGMRRSFSRTVDATDDEVLIAGPGSVFLKAEGTTESIRELCGPVWGDDLPHSELEADMKRFPVATSFPVSVGARFVFNLNERFADKGSAAWRLAAQR